MAAISATRSFFLGAALLSPPPLPPDSKLPSPLPDDFFLPLLRRVLSGQVQVHRVHLTQEGQMGLLHLQLIKPAFLAIRYDMLTFFSWEGADGFSAPPSSGVSIPLLFIASTSSTGDMSASAVSADEAEATCTVLASFVHQTPPVTFAMVSRANEWTLFSHYSLCMYRYVVFMVVSYRKLEVK